ncbi:MAG: hypothetical protein LBE85_09500, partial [Candidatus Accumulibacter sp.]|nr:hypothetical protein [Accumulibacter sp.]
MSIHSRSSSCQRGQARTTARYAAWERTVWREDKRSTSDIENLMIERFFARPEAAIQSSYSPQATNADLPSFYSLHNGDQVIDIERKTA